jgi:hypothetical protein
MTVPAEDVGMERSALESLARFLDRFSDPRFRAGEWITPKSNRENDGAFVMPYIRLDDTASDFIAAAYDNGWVDRELDWPVWKASPEAARLRDDPGAVATAEPQALSRLLTVCIRQDKFVEGALLTAFDSGLILRIVQRAAALLGEETCGGGPSAPGTDPKPSRPRSRPTRR